MPVWLLQIILGLVLNVIAYVLLGAAQKPQPNELVDADGPTSESGKTIIVVFGSGTISGINLLGWWDKESVQRNVESGEGKK